VGVAAVAIVAGSATRAHAVQASGSLQIVPSNWGFVALNEEIDVQIIARNTSTDTPAVAFPDVFQDIAATLSGNISVLLGCTGNGCTGQVPGKMAFVPVGGNGCVAKHANVTGCTSGGGNLVNIAIASPIPLPANGGVPVATIKVKMIDLGGIASLGIHAESEPVGVTACSTSSPSNCVACMLNGCTKIVFTQDVNTGPCPHACPSKIRFIGDAAKPDFFEYHSLIFPGTVIDPPTQNFNITLSNALFNPIFSYSLPPGSFIDQGDAWTYRNLTAQDTGGIAWVKIARRDNSVNDYRIDVQLYDATLQAKATLPVMTVDFSIGPEIFSVTVPWEPKGFGWQLNTVP
jgi:hypothetical protein